MHKTKSEKEIRKAFKHDVTLHHRKPISKGGSRHNPANHSWLPRVKHQAWHTLFDNHSPQSIAYIINDKYLDPEYTMICVRKDSLCTDSS